MGRPKKKPDIREAFGFAIKLRREELSLTQEALAELAQISRTYLSDIERGFRNPALVNIDRLAKALSCTLPGLFQIVETFKDPNIRQGEVGK